MIRKATLIDAKPAQPAELAAALAALKKIAADPNDASMQSSAARLESFVEFRLDPAKRFAQLAAELSAPAPVNGLRDAIGDYTQLLDTQAASAGDSSEAGTGAPPASATTPKPPPDDLTDWLVTFTAANGSVAAAAAAAAEHAFDRWNTSHALPWLVAAIAQAPANSAHASALIEAGAKVDAASPAYFTVAFHRARLLAGTGKRDAARLSLDAVLEQSAQPIPPSARNMILALRMQVAPNLSEWLANAVRTPSLVIIDPDPEQWAPDSELGIDANSPDAAYGKPKPNVPLFDEDAAFALTQKFPLATLVEASQSAAVPESLRRNLTAGCMDACRAAARPRHGRCAICCDGKIFPRASASRRRVCLSKDA